MSKISGIYAASMSILNDDLTLNVKKTISHAENLIEEGCHGIAIFGSTGQAQLIPISEKIELLNYLSKNKYKEKFIVGTGLNSLGETISFMKIAKSFWIRTIYIDTRQNLRTTHSLVTLSALHLKKQQNSKKILTSSHPLSIKKEEMTRMKYGHLKNLHPIPASVTWK